MDSVVDSAAGVAAALEVDPVAAVLAAEADPVAEPAAEVAADLRQSAKGHTSPGCDLRRKPRKPRTFSAV